MVENAPQLEPPGAGLPPFEAWYTRYVAFPLAGILLSNDSALSLFDREGRRALRLAGTVPEEKCSQPVLIDRIWAIEDSSRNWSVAMTLHHLIIVGRNIKRIMLELNDGKEPDITVRIEDVKPDPAAGSEKVEEFASWLDEYPQGLTELPWPKEPKLIHPWFGPIHAAQWLKLNAVHNRIHAKQIQKIVAGLG